MPLKITYTKHALEKFLILAEKNFPVQKGQVRKALERPNTVENRTDGTKIASLILGPTHLLRVVFKYEEKNQVKVITFYPGRRKDYGI